MTAPKNFVVAGGSSGIGFELTRRLIDDGQQVTVLSRTLGQLTELPGIHHIPFDVTRDEFPTGGLPGQLSGLAYCPGSIRLRPFGRLTAEDFLEDYRINLLGAVAVIKGCLSMLNKADNGAAIVMFSTVAVGTGMPFHASIASAKGAVEGLTRSLAAELAPRIRVNAVAPSLTDTSLARALLADDAKRKAAADRHPLKRIGTPGELAEIACFLLSDKAAWITGQIISVDGGMGAVRTFK
ncbi:MAG: SDR family oxidoreductase [Deltaproteobacteria bacterium]|nr:SDR family oxidoreductase [Deltaproteobacteria bacterium]